MGFALTLTVIDGTNTSMAICLVAVTVQPFNVAVAVTLYVVLDVGLTGLELPVPKLLSQL